MSIWHVLLYTAAAVLALRSFVQLMTNYRSESEQIAVTERLSRLRDEVDTVRTEQLAPKVDRETAEVA